MFLLDGDDRLAFVTGALAEWLGTDESSMTGQRLTSYVPDRDAEGVRKTLRAVRAAEGRATRLCGSRLRTRQEVVDVEIEFVSLSQHTEFEDVLGTVRSGADRRTRSELVTARDRFGHLFHLIQDAVIEVEIVEMEPVVRSVNPAFEDVFGYDSATVVGESLNDYIVPPDDSDEAVDFDQRTAEGKPNYAAVTRQTADGRRDFLYRGIPYEREDGGQYGFAIYSDITEQRRARERLQVLHRVMRHNLRNQLTVLQGMARTVNDNSDDPDVLSAAECIVDSARTLNTMSIKAQTAADVLDSPMSNDVVDAVGQSQAVVGRHRSEWPSATIGLDLPERMPVSVGTQLVHALDNLVENALEHGGKRPEVWVVGEMQDTEAELTVADNGPGIPETERAAIFEDAEITQLRHGSGLGLWLVKWIVESAGGRLEYAREDGWTAVTMRLPVQDSRTEVPADD